MQYWEATFFSQGAAISICLSASLSSVCQTWTILWKNLKSVCLCVHVIRACLQKGWDTSCTWHMPRPDWPSLLFLSSLQPSQPSWREGVPGVCCDLSAPEGGFSKQKAHLGCWIGGNQALLSNSMTEMFLALLHFRGQRSSPWQRKPGNTNLTYTKWETLSVHSHGVSLLHSVGKHVMNCKYFWIFCCKYLLIVLLFAFYLIAVFNYWL